MYMIKRIYFKTTKQKKTVLLIIHIKLSGPTEIIIQKHKIKC